MTSSWRTDAAHKQAEQTWRVIEEGLRRAVAHFVTKTSKDEDEEAKMDSGDACAEAIGETETPEKFEIFHFRSVLVSTVTCCCMYVVVLLCQCQEPSLVAP